MDVIGPNSLMDFNDSGYIMGITMALIVLGGGPEVRGAARDGEFPVAGPEAGRERREPENVFTIAITGPTRG